MYLFSGAPYDENFESLPIDGSYFEKIVQYMEQGHFYSWQQFLVDLQEKMLLKVYEQVNNMVNPRSEDNIEAFNSALTNIKDNTFIGSAYTIADTVPNNIKDALSTDSSPVLQFTTAGVSNSYFSIPSKSYSIDFSWYAPFKGVGDTVITAFMFLGFFVAFWKRLPEIIHGAGVVRVDYQNFADDKINHNVETVEANDYYQQLVNNGGRDDFK